MPTESRAGALEPTGKPRMWRWPMHRCTRCSGSGYPEAGFPLLESSLYSYFPDELQVSQFSGPSALPSRPGCFPRHGAPRADPHPGTQAATCAAITRAPRFRQSSAKSKPAQTSRHCFLQDKARERNVWPCSFWTAWSWLSAWKACRKRPRPCI